MLTFLHLCKAFTMGAMDGCRVQNVELSFMGATFTIVRNRTNRLDQQISAATLDNASVRSVAP